MYENTKNFYIQNKDTLDKIYNRSSGWCISLFVTYMIYLLILLLQYTFEALKDFVTLTSDIPQSSFVFVFLYVSFSIIM